MNATIPHGLCLCGCGEQTLLARQTDRRRGHVRGQPQRFVNGHNARLSRPRQPVRLTKPTHRVVQVERWTDDELLDEWAWVRDTCLRDDFPRRVRVGIDRWRHLIARAGRAGDPRAELGRADRDRLDEAVGRMHPARAARGRAA